MCYMLLRVRYGQVEQCGLVPTSPQQPDTPIPHSTPDCMYITPGLLRSHTTHPHKSQAQVSVHSQINAKPILVILTNLKAHARAGIWSRHRCLYHGLSQGSAVNYIQTAIRRGYTPAHSLSLLFSDPSYCVCIIIMYVYICNV